MNQGIVWAFMGTGFTFLMTAFGASVVFILKNDMGKKAEVKVTAEAVDYGAEIYIEDNGIGFEKQNTKFLEEFGGLLYTKYRLMKLCHSEFVIESKKGMGTRVRILLEDMEECI